MFFWVEVDGFLKVYLGFNLRCNMQILTRLNWIQADIFLIYIN